MTDLGVARAEISIDDEASEAMAGVNAVMMTLVEQCPDGSGRERSIDLHKALLVLNGCASILFQSVPESHRTGEMEAFIGALRRAPSGASVRQEGGRA